MNDGEMRYFRQTVKCIRGTEARTIAKWESQGWEVVGQTTGKARTTLELRRPRPTPPWRLIGVAAAVLVVLALVATLVGVLGGGSLSGSGSDEAADAESAAPTQSAEPSTAPESTEDPSSPAPSDSPETNQPDPDRPLTAENSPAFAALLRGNDCGGRVQRFAKVNAGRVVQFDGSISAFAPHDDYDTRFDILLGPGDRGPRTTVGAVFKFEDVGISDLNLTGADIPDRIGTGDRLRLTAELDRYAAQQCILFLDPVETAFR